MKTKRIAIIMGSKSDWPTMREAEKALKVLKLDAHVEILSAHRTPKEMMAFSESARERGFQVIIAGAGGAAHLPGMVASLCSLPVIGVPVPIGELKGQDALLSIVQMPRGVPVATVAIGNAWNAGVLAAQILASGGAQADNALLKRIDHYKQSLRKKSLNSSKSKRKSSRRGL